MTWRAVCTAAGLALCAMGTGCDAGGGAALQAPADAAAGEGDVASDVALDGGDTASEAPPDASPGVGPTYHGAVRAIFQARCTGCHRDGGIAPFSLDGYGLARDLAPVAVAAIEDGRMPPWPPADGCRDIQHARRVLPAELDTLRAWIAAGRPEGDPAEHTPPPGAASPRDLLGPPDLSVAPGAAYAPQPGLTDDYRCFVLDDPAFADEAFLRMLDVRPGNPRTVHHVIVFQVPAASVAEARARDDGTPGPGYTCFGGVGVSGASLLGGWVPGSVPFRYADGDALRVEAGGLLVMQVHYNALETDEPDPGTAVELWLADGPPANLVSFVALAHGGIVIQPGDPSSHHEKTFDNPLDLPVPIMGVLPHMHLLGTAIRVDLTRADGSEQCLVDIPDWHFMWQQQYYFEEVVTFGPLDRARLACTYDNSAANQPVVNGKQLAPRRVTWGEGTLDEMCLAYAILRVPHLPAGAEDCAAFEPCYHACRDGGQGLSYCAVSCTLEAPGCAGCVADSLTGCLAPTCPSEASDLIGCVAGCLTQGAGAGACAFLQCTPAGDALDACAEADVDAGVCDPAFASCQASLARP